MCILISQRPLNHSVCLPKASDCSVVNFAYVHAHACTRRALHMHRAAERRWLQLIAAGRPPGTKKKKKKRVQVELFCVRAPAAASSSRKERNSGRNHLCVLLLQRIPRMLVFRKKGGKPPPEVQLCLLFLLPTLFFSGSL